MILPFLRLLFCTLALISTASAAAVDPVSYNEHIRPILADNCFACHGSDAGDRKAKLRLDQFDSATADRRGVRAIVPGDLANSEAWQRVLSQDPDEIMPPPDSHKKPLSPAQRALLKRWIEQGAVYQNHWAFEPVARPVLPSPLAGAKENGGAIDHFIAAKLNRHQLTLAPEAPREALLRRLTLDLTGLPPTPAELDAFLADYPPTTAATSPAATSTRRAAAFDRVVTRLLASPRFGEHFARTWLDAVRYADSHGLHLDNVRTIWPYRDWVAAAYNRNVPFDQFTIEQLAGDLLPNPRIDQLVASGYNRNHLTTSEGGSIEEEAEARNNIDRINTTATVWLGLTAGCAQCHDHKFDPISQRDYYSLGAFFKGLADRVWDGNIPKPGPLVVLGDATVQARLKAIDAAFPPLAAALSAKAEAAEKAQKEKEKSHEIAAVVATVAKVDTDDDTDTLSPAKRKQAPAKPTTPVSYEVVWAEDADTPYAINYGKAAPAGEWRTGPGVPVVGGQRALHLEGSQERPVNFGGGELLLIVRTTAQAFAHFQADPAQPPRAVSLQFISEQKTKRVIWGDPAAFGPEVAKDAIVAGPMPAPGSYTRLEIDAGATGLAKDKPYSGLIVAQSDGAGWWDHIGTACTSPSAAVDPLLNSGAWVTGLRNFGRAEAGLPLPHEAIFLIGLSGTQQTTEEKARVVQFHRDFIMGPLRATLEPEANAARRLLVERTHYESTLPSSLVSRERATPHPAPILLRGQYDKPGELVTPATPAFLPPLAATSTRPSRLDLARWLVDAKNPLTARVTANRFWQQLFGAGLVRTPGDFGTQGDPPTHPELLDWLASELVRTGWDVKAFVRLLVTSRAYRQESNVTPELLALDPENKLLARSSRLRLDAEVLRDQALALGGLLRPEIGGPPVRPYQPINIWEPVAFGGSNTKTYVQDHGHALYRRSLYTFMKRTAPAPAMSTFDAPSREFTCVGRSRSNTPLQALALMNDVQHVEAARTFAERLLAEKSTDAIRLALAFRSVTAREPDTTERQLLTHSLATHRAHFSRDTAAAEKILTNGESKSVATAPAAEIAAWTMVTNLLLNLDETVTRN